MAAPDAPPASDNAPATPNVTAFARLLRFEACFACDIVETSHIKSDGCGPRAKQIVATHPRLRSPLREGPILRRTTARREAHLPRWDQSLAPVSNGCVVC